MSDVLAKNLSRKEVMGDDGASLGTLYNLTMDLKTGTLQDLIVDTGDRSIESSFDRDEEGRLLVPVARVQAVKDTIVVAR
jgi:sporulation protein YlmC with PRC-barrel domain